MLRVRVWRIVRRMARTLDVVAGLAAGLLLVACGASDGSAGGTAPGQQRDMLIPACSVPPAASTFGEEVGRGCTPYTMFQICQVPSGSVIHSDGTITTPDGGTVTCHDACAPTEYSLWCIDYTWPHPSIPAPDPSLGCSSLGIPTSPFVNYFCCPCDGR